LKYKYKLKEVLMKRLFAIGIALMLLAGLTGCQIPGGTEAIEKITEAVEMMEEVEMQLDEIQAQLDEITDAFNALADDYDKHLEKYHKAKPIKKTITKGPKKKITK
jgi:DNA repair ATPase RecN